MVNEARKALKDTAPSTTAIDSENGGAPSDKNETVDRILSDAEALAAKQDDYLQKW